MTHRASPLLGCIADDFTGRTDLASILVKAGMRTVQTVGVPQGGAPAGVDVIVGALKSRTFAPADAVLESLAALRWLQAAVNAIKELEETAKIFLLLRNTSVSRLKPAKIDELKRSFDLDLPSTQPI